MQAHTAALHCQSACQSWLLAVRGQDFTCTTLTTLRRTCRGSRTLLKSCSKRGSLTCRVATQENDTEDGAPQVLFHMQTQHNTVQVLKFPKHFSVENLSGATALFLDRSGNIHSIYRDDEVLTGHTFYWDQLCIVAALAPEGPIGVLGLGSGTVPRIIHHYWPERLIHGWELDPCVLFAARDHMGMQSLEDSGALIAHTGDALGDDAIVEGGFAALIVDLFSEGHVVPQLQDPEVWKKLKQRLRPGGRLFANLGAQDLGHPAASAMIPAFGDGGLCMKASASNVLVLTGSPPSPEQAASLPKELRGIAEGWEDHESALPALLI